MDHAENYPASHGQKRKSYIVNTYPNKKRKNNVVYKGEDFIPLINLKRKEHINNTYPNKRRRYNTKCYICDFYGHDPVYCIYKCDLLVCSKLDKHHINACPIRHDGCLFCMKLDHSIKECIHICRRPECIQLLRHLPHDDIA